MSPFRMLPSRVGSWPDPKTDSPERHLPDIHSSLLRTLANYGLKKFYNIGPRFSSISLMLQARKDFFVYLSLSLSLYIYCSLCLSVLTLFPIFSVSLSLSLCSYSIFLSLFLFFCFSALLCFFYPSLLL
jgi:hypothetical protein